ELGEFERLEELNIDGLKIVQDERLYRFTSDSVLLSKFAQGKRGEYVADFCAGSGIVGLHFYALNRHTTKNLKVVLFEMQTPLCELSKKSIAYNGFEADIKAVNCKIQEIPADYHEKFSLVLCNPPYERGGFDNEVPQKAVCRKEITVNLEEIALAAAKALKYGGRIALVNRADRVAEICYTLKKYGLEVKKLQFVSGKAGAKPYLLMVEAVKGGKPTCEILPTVANEK
ncbi:MAG: methyltransferase, partial [Clostridia bacterium]|nr:methyltransferase [Clostridia bacterium]